MIRWTRAAFVVTLLAGSLFVAVPPASASYTEACFYNGVFRDGSHVLRVDWNVDGKTDQCFGIAPDRTIWNSWPGSGGWAEMPGEGRADEMCNADLSPLYKFHTVYVIVNGQGVYSSAYDTYTHKWKPWAFRGTNVICILFPDR